MKKLFSLIILSSIFASCKKNGQPPILENKGLLVHTMSTLAASLDTIVGTYTYDDNNRIIKVVSTRTGVDVPTTIAYYTYDASGNLTSKTLTDANNYEVSKFIVNYVNGQPNSIRLIYTLGQDTISNSITNTLTVQNNRVVSMNGPTGPTIDTITYTGNNVRQFLALRTGDGTGTYIYGTQNGPFKNSRFNWVFDLGEGNIFMEFDQNDMVGLSGSSYLAFHNTYNSQGYPIQIIYNTGSIIWRFTYINAN
jgi:YD repeat-containing protein